MTQSGAPLCSWGCYHHLKNIIQNIIITRTDELHSCYDNSRFNKLTTQSNRSITYKQEEKMLVPQVKMWKITWNDTIFIAAYFLYHNRPVLPTHVVSRKGSEHVMCCSLWFETTKRTSSIKFHRLAPFQGKQKTFLVAGLRKKRLQWRLRMQQSAAITWYQASLG